MSLDDIDTLIAALDVGEERILLRRASNEQLTQLETLLEEECTRLRALLKHPESDRLAELGAKQLGMMAELDQLKQTESGSARVSKLEEEFQRESKEYFTLRELVWGHNKSLRSSKDSHRLNEVNAVQIELWDERDRRAGIADADDEEE